MKLHQLLAVTKPAVSAGEGALTRAYQAFGKTALLSGVSKTYTARDEEGQQLPPEGVKLQLRVPVILNDLMPALVRQIDMTASVDAGNQIAVANVVVGGKVVLGNVPVETLLFLEKKLAVLSEVIGSLPVLEESEDWELADDNQSFKTKPALTVRTNKVARPFVKAEATDKHPAQVDVVYQDEVVGTWSTIKFSGAIKASRKRQLVENLVVLTAAIKVARGEANSVEVTEQKIGQTIMDLLGWAE